MLYVYLDQWNWIDLAKALVGKPDGMRFQRALNVARQAAESGTAVFPLSAVHFIETAKSPREDQRSVLARLMTELSQGVVLRATRQMVAACLPRAIQASFGERSAEPNLSPFSRAFEDVFDFTIGPDQGIADQDTDRVRSFVDSPKGRFDFLLNNGDSERIAGNKAVHAIGVNAAAINEAVRAALSNEDLNTFQRAYAARLTMIFMEPISEHLRSIGRSFRQWLDLGPDRLMQFWRSIPCLDVELELHTQMHRMKSRKWEPNDVMDIGALSQAIPACNIVVTERIWADLIRRRGLNVKYETSVFCDLAEMASALTPAS